MLWYKRSISHKYFFQFEKVASAYSFKTSYNWAKNRRQSFQELFKLIRAENIDNPAQVVSNKDKPYIGWGSFYRFLGHDIGIPPLPLDNSIWVFHDGLPSKVKFLVNIKSEFVSMYQVCVFRAFKYPPVFIPGALLDKRAFPAFICFVMFYFIVGLWAVFVVLVSIGR